MKYTETNYTEMDPFELRDALQDQERVDILSKYDKYAANSVEVYLKAQKELVIPTEEIPWAAQKALAVAYEIHHPYGIYEILNAVSEFADLYVKE